MRLHTSHRVDEAGAHHVQLLVGLPGLFVAGGLRVEVALRTLLRALNLLFDDHVRFLSVGGRLSCLRTSSQVSAMVAQLLMAIYGSF